MKKLIIFILLLIIPFKVNASYVVMDMDNNRVLYGSNIHEKKLIASTTKILTALVVVNNAKDINRKIEVGEEVLKSFGSGIYIEVGEHISIKDLLYGLLLRSGNDAAITLAYYVGGSMEGFASLMNETAFSIGMKDSTFINSSGLEDNKGNGNISTSYDMALLMSYVSKNKTLMNIMSTKKYTVKTDKKSYEWHNKNKLLNDFKYTTGGKTGYTKKAYRTLVTSASKGNTNITVVTLGEKDDFLKHKNAYINVFNNYKKVKVIKSKNRIGDTKTCIDNNYYVLLNNKEKKNIKYEFNKVNDSTKRNGLYKIYLNNELIDTIDTYECKNNKLYNIINKFF